MAGEIRTGAALWAAVLAMIACGAGSRLAAAEAERGSFEETFERFDADAWYKADYVFSHPHFDTDWRADYANVDGRLTLTLAPQSGENRFAGASIRRQEPTHFGRYEAVLTAARGAGVVTGFFLYSGPAYGTQHDEIDWEIFGQDTRTAQVAWWQDGVLRSKRIDLGFDAAAGPNHYAIDWAPDKLRWYVNGDLVHEASDAIPQTPQRLFANVWAVDAALGAWAGLPVEGHKTQAIASMIRHMPAR